MLYRERSGAGSRPTVAFSSDSCAFVQFYPLSFGERSKRIQSH